MEQEIKTEKQETDSNENEIKSLNDLGPYLQKQNNAQCFVYESKIPDICKSEPCMLGIDEAGRGPVLGPMVYGIAFCPLTKVKTLETLGCADSKELTEVKREEIFNNLTTQDWANLNIGWSVEVIAPNEISMSMQRRTKRTLNEVSMDSAIGLIQRAIDADVNIAEIYVDTVGPPEKYQAKLLALFPDYQITVAKKADSTYPIVSAASICAKVSRDHALKVWQFAEGLTLTHEEFGSGYPGDPKTKMFMREYIDPVFGFPRLVRFSWRTATDILDKETYCVTFEEDEPPEKMSKSQSKIKSFFKSDETIKHERHEFFKDRCLENVVDFI